MLTEIQGFYLVIFKNKCQTIKYISYITSGKMLRENWNFSLIKQTFSQINNDEKHWFKYGVFVTEI